MGKPMDLKDFFRLHWLAYALEEVDGLVCPPSSVTVPDPPTVSCLYHTT